MGKLQTTNVCSFKNQGGLKVVLYECKLDEAWLEVGTICTGWEIVCLWHVCMCGGGSPQ